jgi:hypothetical protein
MSNLTAESYLWEHWKFNADQRLKAFNLYVMFAIFGNGMVFTAIDRDVNPMVLVFLGGFECLLALVFAMVDRRSRKLLHLAKQGLKSFEQNLPADCRPFLLDDVQGERWARYTVAFNLLFVLQFLFGVLMSGYGAARWLGWWPGV